MVNSFYHPQLWPLTGPASQGSRGVCRRQVSIVEGLERCRSGLKPPPTVARLQENFLGAVFSAQRAVEEDREARPWGVLSPACSLPYPHEGLWTLFLVVAAEGAAGEPGGAGAQAWEASVSRRRQGVDPVTKLVGY